MISSRFLWNDEAFHIFFSFQSFHQLFHCIVPHGVESLLALLLLSLEGLLMCSKLTMDGPGLLGAQILGLLLLVLVEFAKILLLCLVHHSQDEALNVLCCFMTMMIFVGVSVLTAVLTAVAGVRFPILPHLMDSAHDFFTLPLEG